MSHIFLPFKPIISNQYHVYNERKYDSPNIILVLYQGFGSIFDPLQISGSDHQETGPGSDPKKTQARLVEFTVIFFSLKMYYFNVNLVRKKSAILEGVWIWGFILKRNPAFRNKTDSGLIQKLYPNKAPESASPVYSNGWGYVWWCIARLCVESDLHPVVEEGAEGRQREGGHEYGDEPELKHWNKARCMRLQLVPGVLPKEQLSSSFLTNNP